LLIIPGRAAFGTFGYYLVNIVLLIDTICACLSYMMFLSRNISFLINLEQEVLLLLFLLLLFDIYYFI
jgi:Na+/alanine symporter